jgi:hypothetical protein
VADALALAVCHLGGAALAARIGSALAAGGEGGAAGSVERTRGSSTLERGGRR